MFIQDKNFKIEYTVHLVFYDTTQKKAINNYKNSSMECLNDNGIIAFYKPQKNINDAISFYLLHKTININVNEFDINIICEYYYNNEIVASDYLDNIDMAITNIADASSRQKIKQLQNTINSLESQLELLQPVLQLQMQDINKILEFAKSKI